MKWRRTREREPDTRPLVSALVAPNKTSRRYFTEPELGSLTSTPHREMFGMDASHIYKYPKMDEETLELYHAVRALDRGIQSVSILPNELDIGHEWRALPLNRLAVDWLPDFDTAVVDCLVKHMGWTEGARLATHRQTEAELWGEMDAIVAQAVVLRGVEPPKGWPYKRR